MKVGVAAKVEVLNSNKLTGRGELEVVGMVGAL
jgi:hypothetical protein